MTDGVQAKLAKLKRELLTPQGGSGGGGGSIPPLQRNDANGQWASMCLGRGLHRSGSSVLGSTCA